MLPFARTFIAPNGTLLPAFDPRFYVVQGNIVIDTDAACGTSTDPVVDVVGIADAFAPAQFVEGLVARLGGVSYTGLALRCGAPGSGDGYWWLGSAASGGDFGYILAGAFNVLFSPPAFAAGNFIRMEVDDSTNFNFLINGVSVATFSDATFPLGTAGISGFRNDLASGMANIRAGNLRPQPNLYMPAFVGGL